MKYFLSISLILISILAFLFSYLWVDLAIVLLLANSHPVINSIYPYLAFGEANRMNFMYIYLVWLSIFFLVQLLIFKFGFKNTKFWLVVAAITTFIFTLSYPLFSHDIFTYLFFNHVAVSYQLNPYVVTPEQFAQTDLWVGFVHSVQGTYRYGVVFLIYSILPMIIIGGDSFLTNFLALKFLNGIIFFVCGYVLYRFSKKNSKVFALWFFNPLLVIELLINAHNDLLMIVLFIFGVIALKLKKYLLSVPLILASAATKYVSIFALPVVLMNELWQERFFKLCLIVLPIYLYFTGNAVHMWYFAWLYMFIPFVNFKKVSMLLIYLSGFIALINYSQFIKTKSWDADPLIGDPRILILILLSVIVILEVGSFFQKKKNV